MELYCCLFFSYSFFYCGGLCHTGPRMAFKMFRLYYLLSTLYCFWTLQLARMIHIYICIMCQGQVQGNMNMKRSGFLENCLFSWHSRLREGELEIVCLDHLLYNMYIDDCYPHTAAYEGESQRFVRRFLAIHCPLLCQQEED